MAATYSLLYFKSFPSSNHYNCSLTLLLLRVVGSGFLNHLFEHTQDVVTYYLNLTRANVARGRWEKEYRLTESFRVPDASPSSMHQVLERIANSRCYLQKYYEFNSVSYDLMECNNNCRADHVCAAREVDFNRYEHCLEKEGAAAIYGGLFPLLSVALSLVLVSL